MPLKIKFQQKVFLLLIGLLSITAFSASDVAPPGTFKLDLNTPLVCSNPDIPSSCEFISIPLETIEITIKVYSKTEKIDGYDEPMSPPEEGAEVSFSITGPSASLVELSPTSAITNSAGEANIRFRSTATNLGEYTITAHCSDGRTSSKILNIQNKWPIPDVFYGNSFENIFVKNVQDSFIVTNRNSVGDSTSFTKYYTVPPNSEFIIGAQMVGRIGEAPHSKIVPYPGIEPINFYLWTHNRPTLDRDEVAQSLASGSTVGFPKSQTSDENGIVSTTITTGRVEGELLVIYAQQDSPNLNKIYNQNYSTNILVTYNGTKAGIEKYLPKIKQEKEGVTPNPLGRNTKANIKYHLSNNANVEIQIVNISGQLIWQNTQKGRTGSNNLMWNGKNLNGKTIANGIYHIKIKPQGQKVRSFSLAVFGN